MSATAKERQASLKARRKAAGLVQVKVWVHPESREIVKSFAAATIVARKDLERYQSEKRVIDSTR